MDVARLSIAVDSSDLGKTTAEMDKLKASSSRLENTTKFLRGAFADLAMGMVGTTAIFGAVSAVAMDVTTHLDRVRERSQQLAHEMAAASVAAGGLEKSLRSELAVLEDAVPGSRAYLSTLDDLEVTKARLYALGPEYRKGINDEVMSYQDLLGVLRKINQEKLRAVEIQIAQQEGRVGKASNAGWLTDVGLMLSGTGSGLGSYLQARGIESTLNLMNEENGRLNKLLKDRAELMALLRDPKPGKDTASAASAASVTARARGPQDDPLSDFYYFSIPEHFIENIEVATVNTVKLEMASAKVRQEYERMRIVIPTTWDIIAGVVTDSSRMASDELVIWMNNLDGVGRSWETLGDTVGRVLENMIVQMQRAILQQQVMDPLMGWAVKAIGGWASGGSTAVSSGSAAGNAAGSAAGAIGGLLPQFGVVGAPSIVVNVSSTGKASAESQGKGGVELARMVESAVDAWAVKNRRVGGALA